MLSLQIKPFFHLLCGSKNRQEFITSLSFAFVMFPVLCGTSCYILYCFFLDEVDSYVILFVMLWKHQWGQMLTSYCLVGPRVSLITWQDGKTRDQLPNAHLAAFINTNLTPSFHHSVSLGPWVVLWGSEQSLSSPYILLCSWHKMNVS